MQFLLFFVVNFKISLSCLKYEVKKLLLAWTALEFSSLTLYSIDTRFLRHLKTLWHNVFKALQLKKCSFLSAEWTFKFYLNVVCCKIAVWGKGLSNLYVYTYEENLYKNGSFFSCSLPKWSRSIYSIYKDKSEKLILIFG